MEMVSSESKRSPGLSIKLQVASLCFDKHARLHSCHEWGYFTRSNS